MNFAISNEILWALFKWTNESKILYLDLKYIFIFASIFYILSRLLVNFSEKFKKFSNLFIKCQTMNAKNNKKNNSCMKTKLKYLERLRKNQVATKWVSVWIQMICVKDKHYKMLSTSKGSKIYYPKDLEYRLFWGGYFSETTNTGEALKTE